MKNTFPSPRPSKTNFSAPHSHPTLHHNPQHDTHLSKPDKRNPVVKLHQADIERAK